MLTAGQLDALGGEGFELRGNQRILLDDADTLWVVRAGSLAIFSTAVVDGDPEGARRSLFHLRAGHAAFSVDSSGGTGLLAVATQPTRLQRIPFASLADQLGDEEYGELIEDWVGHLLGCIEVPQGPVSPRRTSAAREGSLGGGDALLVDHERTLWVTPAARAELMGLPCAELPAEVAFPLSPRSWIRAGEDLHYRTVETRDLADSPERLAESMQCLQATFTRTLDWFSQQEHAEESERLARRAARASEATASSLRQLTAVLESDEVVVGRETPLLTAVGVVGQEIGVEVRPPLPSEDMSRVRDPLDAIARASRVRKRRLLLRGDWWKRDAGPLVAYLGEERRRPVALVVRGAGYEVVDGESCTRSPLTAELRQELCPDAYTLYRPLPEATRSVFGLVGFSARGRLGDFVFVIVVGILTTLLGMLIPQATALLVDEAIPNADGALLAQLALAIGAVAVGSALFSLAQGLVILRLGLKSDIVSQSALCDRLLRLRPSFFRKYSSGDLQSRVMAVSEVGQELNGITLRGLLTGLLASLNLGLLYYYSARLAVVAIVVAFAIVLVTSVVGLLVRQKAVLLEELRGEFFGLVIQMVGGVPKLRVAGAERRAFNHWVVQYAKQLQLLFSTQALQDTVFVFHAFLQPASTIVLFWLGVEMMAGGQEDDAITMGIFLAFFTAFGSFLRGSEELSTTLVRVLETITKGKRIRPLLTAEVEVGGSAGDPGRLAGRVELDGVTFRYGDEGPLTLDDVSLHADPGEFIALVGPSGSGKSTALRLLLGFEEPSAGVVLYDGQDLAGLDVLAVRRQIGVVLQNGRVNAGSIYDNIAQNAQLTYDEAWEAAADAGIADDIHAMPMKLHTVVSEGGTNLSGGQRQRLLVARALAMRPKLIYFDEATSALDNRTQSVVSEALQRRRVTRVVIAHRLSTIVNADRIYVLDHGRVTQQGTFAELTEREGVFRHLFQRQMV